MVGTTSLTAERALAAGRLAGDFALGQGLSSVESYFIDLAVVEACTNVQRHGYPDGAGGIDIWLLAHEGGVLVRIIDQGLSIPEDCLAQARRHQFPEAHEALDDVAEGGMGLPVIFKTMDAVHYEAAAHGNSLLMFKRAAVQPVTTP